TLRCPCGRGRPRPSGPLGCATGSRSAGSAPLTKSPAPCSGSPQTRPATPWGSISSSTAGPPPDRPVVYHLLTKPITRLNGMFRAMNGGIGEDCQHGERGGDSGTAYPGAPRSPPGGPCGHGLGGVVPRGGA